MSNIWKLINENIHIVVIMSINLIAAIVYPVYLPFMYNPVSPVDFNLFTVFQYITFGLYCLYLILVFIPKTSIFRLIGDFGIFSIQLFIIIGSALNYSVLYPPMDIGYTIAIASLTLAVEIYQIVKYFISKRVIHLEKDTTQKDLA